MQNIKQIIIREAVIALISLLRTLFTSKSIVFSLTTLLISVTNLVLVCKPKK